jgi:hypothetical protein
MGLVMTGPRVWLRPAGRVLAHRPDGWPLPTPDHAEQVEAVVGAGWLWQRRDVQACHRAAWAPCRQLAVWRTTDATFRGYYCDSHLPHTKPTEPPAETCNVCTGPLDPWLPANGYTTHPCCEEPA